MLKLLNYIQKFFNQEQKNSTVDQFKWPETVDKWIEEDYPENS